MWTHKKSQHLLQNSSCVDTLLQIKGILCRSAQGASTAELQSTVNFYYTAESQAGSCCGRLNSYFSSHCPVSPRGQALDFQHPLLGLRLSNTTEPRAGREHSSHFYFNCRQLSCLALTVQILFPESFFPRALPHHQNHPACECTTEILFISLKQTPKKLENLSPKPKKISWIHFPKK